MKTEWIEHRLENYYFDIIVRYSRKTKNVSVHNLKTNARTRLNMKICEQVYKNCDETSFEWFCHFMRDCQTFAELKPCEGKNGYELAVRAKNNGMELFRVLLNENKNYSQWALLNELLYPYTDIIAQNK